MIRRLFSVMVLAGTLAGVCAAEGNSPYQKLADDLAAQIQGDPIEVRLGNFLYADTVQMSEFSALLRSELQRALAQTGRFTVLASDRLGELEDEKKYQLAKLMEPGVRTRGLSLPGTMLRGKFFYAYPDVTVQVELAWLDSGRQLSAKVTIPADQVSARIWPKESPGPAQLGSVVQPAAFAASTQHVQIVTSRINALPQDLDVRLEILGESAGTPSRLYPKRDFAAGEYLHCRITSGQPCHIAVVCLQADGSNVLLYPNAYSRNTWVARGEAALIPGTGRDTFRLPVQEPWGSDVVLAIACTRDGDLFRLLRELASGASTSTGVRGLEMGRDALLEKLGESGRGVGVERDDQIPLNWGHDRQVICTYPRR